MFASYMVLLATSYFELTKASIPTVNIAVSDVLHMQHGMGWPYVLQLMEGQDALIQLKLEPPINSCYLTTSVGEKFSINSPSSNKYEKWTDGCGVRIKTIAKKDVGRWRLTATKGNRTYVGWSQIHVYNDVSKYQTPDITLEDGQDTTVQLSTLANSYCFVEQPFSEGTLVAGQCRVRLPRATRAVQGTWNIFLGIPGRVQEVHVQRQVFVKSESLDAGYVYDRVANKLHFYCNLMHSVKSLTFCRFQRTSSSSGFNVLDGLSDGSHSYYGTGFLNKQCGMTIENPTSADFGTWRCSVGTRKLVAANMEEQPPIQALISTTSSVHSETDVRRIAHEHEDTSTVFIRVDHPFTLHCRKDTINLQYCWFLHPNGTQYTPVVGQNETNSHDFWYEGESLQSGDCGITFRSATNDDSGEWTCHMGARNTYGVEIVDKINVKVTGALAANRKNITTKIGDTVHLFCHTSNGNKPLEYCRFLSPQFTGINIHTTITEENAIDGNYYFTPGNDLKYGDCSLTIKSVREQDIGSWSCAALIIDTIMEASDDIYLSYEITRTGQPLSQGSIVGMTVGVFILVVGLAGFLVYKKFGPPSQWGHHPQIDILPMANVNRRASNGSGSSEESGASAHNLNVLGDETPVNYVNSDSTDTTVRFTPNNNNIVILE